MVEYRAQFRGSPGSVRAARRAVVDYARLCGFDTTQTYEIALGTGEALANAVEHGTKDLGFITVSCRFDGSDMTIEISDEGPGFDFGGVAQRRRDPDAVRGFGISIMHSVMDDVRYERHGNCVRLRKRRASPAAPAVRSEREA
jgi:anti-sigma regulatory factor (Ser/Thr protein kinase)